MISVGRHRCFGTDTVCFRGVGNRTVDDLKPIGDGPHVELRGGRLRRTRHCKLMMKRLKNGAKGNKSDVNGSRVKCMN